MAAAAFLPWSLMLAAQTWLTDWSSSFGDSERRSTDTCRPSAMMFRHLTMRN